MSACPGRVRPNSVRRRQRQGGQSLVEFAIALPILLVILALSYVGWDAIHSAIGMTSGARAAALTAASDLSQDAFPLTPLAVTTALNDATAALNAEEGTNIYQTGCPPPPGKGCVSLATDPAVPTFGGKTYRLVTISIVRPIATTLPVFRGVTVRVKAGASWSKT